MHFLEHYRGWTGTFPEFVELIDRIFAENAAVCSFAPKAPGTTLLRHYQNKGAVGRGITNSTRPAIFGFREILETVAARVLISDKWPLDKIATFRQNASEQDLLDAIATPTGCPQISTPPHISACVDTPDAFLAAMGPSSLSDDPGQKQIAPWNPAQKLIEKFRGQANAVATRKMPPHAPSLRFAAVRPATETTLLSYSPLPGIEVLVDESQIGQMTSLDIDAAFAAIAQTLKKKIKERKSS